MTLQPGLEATVEQVITDSDTALSLGSGDVDVLGTPAVVALCERAAVSAVNDHIEETQTTVGSRIELDHLAPTVVGRTVTVRARLEKVAERLLEFTIDASDDSGEIARGSHRRVIVDRSRFLDGARHR